jgi:hypothetical protein
VIGKGFKKCCLSDEMDGKEDEKQVWNVGSEYQTQDGSSEKTEFPVKFVI